MVRNIDRDGLRDLVETRHAQLAEVLPRKEYEWAHLPGAVHVPLAGLDDGAAKVLDEDRPLIVYCNDAQCDMSPRAAHRLRNLGFAEVYDYVDGKLDWLAFDLPYEGKATLVSRVVRRDPVLAGLDDPLGQVADRIVADPAGLAVVVDGDRVVHGVIGGEHLSAAGEGVRAEEAMEVGTPTVRPGEDIEELTGRLDRKGMRDIVVTRSDATLVGLFSTAAVGSPRSGPRP